MVCGGEKVVTEICHRCGGSGSNHNLIKPGACPICLGNGYVDMETVVKKYRKHDGQQKISE